MSVPLSDHRPARGRLLASVALAAVLATAPLPLAPARAETPPPRSGHALPLGPDDLHETRTTQTLQRGVTLTSIVRGEADPGDAWTVELSIPAGATSPDPDAPATAVADRATADALADRVRAAGDEARVEEVVTPATADYAGGSLGFRVRAGRLATRAEADALRARLVAAGFTAASQFTGWDGDAADRGPWRVQVLTVDPRSFRGRLLPSFGPDLEDRETTSALSREAGATAAVNGGYFVLDPASGAPGDPAGVGVYGGRLLSETVDGRPGLVLRDSARGTRIARLRWSGMLTTPRGPRLTLDGIDRVPGLIRNCGGTADDRPTAQPRHDVTCTDADELVAFTPEFGAATPAGPGLEAVIDRRQRVVSLRSPRGGPLLPGQRAVQATGGRVAALAQVAAVGQRLRIVTRLRDTRGGVVAGRASTSVVNGGPELVRHGRLHVTPQADGFVRPGDPSFYYGFSTRRNPRTFAGTDAAGRTLLVTADGRSTASLGLSIVETGTVARALGMREAVNLDGGGSTTMVVGGGVVNQPSDATGERPVGDALLVLPGGARSGRR